MDTTDPDHRQPQLLVLVAPRLVGAGGDRTTIRRGRHPARSGQHHEEILRWSPTARVPALKDGEIFLWDSLAICEHLAEAFPEAGLWPTDARARATARSVVAEMHSGFVALRKHMPMNLRASYPVADHEPGVEEDIARITEIWEECRMHFGADGDLLFGGFTIADAFYAPIVSRFRTYGVSPGGIAGEYMDAVWALPAMQDWAEKARAEEWSVERYDR